MAKGFKNTPYNGEVRTLIYQEDDTWYGVALEFNIVETGSNPQEVMIMLDEAIAGYIEATYKTKMSIGVLNQKVNELFDTLWKTGEAMKESKQKVYSAGRQPLAAFA
jgi:predicted RNase H-like HicB family nuclease